MKWTFTNVKRSLSKTEGKDRETNSENGCGFCTATEKEEKF